MFRPRKPPTTSKKRGASYENTQLEVSEYIATISPTLKCYLFEALAHSITLLILIFSAFLTIKEQNPNNLSIFITITGIGVLFLVLTKHTFNRRRKTFHFDLIVDAFYEGYAPNENDVIRLSDIKKLQIIEGKSRDSSELRLCATDNRHKTIMSHNKPLKISEAGLSLTMFLKVPLQYIQSDETFNS